MRNIACIACLLLRMEAITAFENAMKSLPISVSTSADRALNMSFIDPPILGRTGNETWFLKVDSSMRRQIVTGFGAAWTDSAVVCLNSLSTSLQNEILDLFFGSEGIGLNLMRHTIGQSDLTPSSIGEWSYDSNEGVPDQNMKNFSLTPAGEAMVHYLQRMNQVNPSVKLFGSPWSPPQWMKNQHNNIQVQYTDAWTLYMVSYLKAFRDNGVHVHALTPQNEPLHSSDPAWTTEMSAQFQVLQNKRV